MWAGPHISSVPEELLTEPCNGSITLTVIRHVTRQVWVTGELARGRIPCSGSLPGGSCWNTPLSSEQPWAGAGAALAKVGQLRECQVSCYVLRLSVETPWQGVGTGG